jgi:hypothetical protein
MATFIGAFPVLPGKDDDAHKFAQETMGRGEEFSASQKRGGVTKEEWAFQQSPMGSLMLVHFEANDIEKAFGVLAESSEDFDVWFRGRVQELTGVDLAAEPEGPPPEIVLDWRA